MSLSYAMSARIIQRRHMAAVEYRRSFSATNALLAAHVGRISAVRLSPAGGVLDRGEWRVGIPTCRESRARVGDRRQSPCLLRCRQTARGAGCGAAGPVNLQLWLGAALPSRPGT